MNSHISVYDDAHDSFCAVWTCMHIYTIIRTWVAHGHADTPSMYDCTVHMHAFCVRL